MTAALAAVPLAGAYIIPPALGIYWRSGTTWLGKTALTWAFLAVVYDIAFVRDRDFGVRDAGVTLLGAVLYRAFRNKVM